MKAWTKKIPLRLRALGDTLRALRRQRGLTLREAARDLGRRETSDADETKILISDSYKPGSALDQSCRQ